MRSICWKRDRQRTGLQDQREVLRLTDRAAVPRSISAFGPGMPSGLLLEVDVRRRLELAVEHDREVLGVVQVVALLARRGRTSSDRAAPLPRDLLELARAVVRELQRHDRPAALAEVGARAREHEVAARSSPARCSVRAVRVVVHQVVVGAGRRHDARAEAARRGLAAHDHACAPAPSAPVSFGGTLPPYGLSSSSSCSQARRRASAWSRSS